MSRRIELPPEGEQPLVSVITRTRNRRGFLEEAVRSVAAQTWRNVELVVVNDGGEPVNDLLEPHRARLRIVSLEPGRVGRCRAGNLGLEASSGAYLAYLDDDDRYLPGHLAEMVTALEGSPLKFAYSDPWRVDLEWHEGAGGFREVGRSVPYSVEFSRLRLLKESYIHIVSVVHARELWERLGGFDEELEVLEDLDLFFRYAQEYDFLHVKTNSAEFRIRSDASNAVTAMPREFMDTRRALLTKYMHIGFQQLMGALDHGSWVVGELTRRIEALEEEVRRLKEAGP